MYCKIQLHSDTAKRAAQRENTDSWYYQQKLFRSGKSKFGTLRRASERFFCTMCHLAVYMQLWYTMQPSFLSQAILKPNEAKGLSALHPVCRRTRRRSYRDCTPDPHATSALTDTLHRTERAPADLPVFPYSTSRSRTAIKPRPSFAREQPWIS